MLFYALRQLEVWLHQHIFKVGWLVTKQYQTTTILYYAFFLPGIILNQFIFWLAAGFLNVSAERSIAWPQKQEIGELKLDFIRLSKNVGPLPFAVISTTPLLVGMFAVWQIANNILNVPTFLTELNQGGFLVNLSTALAHFTSAPDFWIWVYLAFAVSNTMMPNFANLRGWRIILIVLGVLIAALYVLGAGDQVVMNNLRGPVTDALNSLSSIFAIIIGLDIFMVAVLGTLEAIIERITGDSATFENGKMVTLRRSELLARRQQALAVRPQQRTQKAAAVPVGPPSVYKLQFPIPGAPGKEAVSVSPQMVISQEIKPAAPTPQLDTRSGPAVISGTVAEKLPPPSTSQTSSPIPANPATPMSKPAASPAAPTTPAASPFNKPATPAAASGASPVPSTSPFNKPATPAAASGTSPAPSASPFNKPAAPTGGSPAPSTSPFSKPATPVGGSPAPSTSPFNKPATPMGSPPSPTAPKPLGMSPTTATGSFKPAAPMGTSSPRPAAPGSPSPIRPAPKPVSPFASTDDEDDDEEIEDVDDIEDDDDEVSYQDFEDPA
ncbi:MAG: hypothetical protein LCI00_03820 [Chloroflexi bacterium]|nr:hypothetical protein [Chloroflexota bacterium]MCC6891250.1 hypothetical protein [Anaerolineae bacterium]